MNKRSSTLEEVRAQVRQAALNLGRLLLIDRVDADVHIAEYDPLRGGEQPAVAAWFLHLETGGDVSYGFKQNGTEMPLYVTQGGRLLAYTPLGAPVDGGVLAFSTYADLIQMTDSIEVLQQLHSTLKGVYGFVNTRRSVNPQLRN